MVIHGHQSYFFVEFGINKTMNVSMGKSLYELVFIVQPQLPLDIILGSD